MQEAATPEILWFKTAYVTDEDRLRLACSLKGGGSDVMWLTQRLGNALLKKLLEWLDKASVQDERFAEDAHRVAQQSALSKLPKRAPAAIPDGPAWLVHSVGIRTTKQGLLLTFKDAGERALCIRFDAPRLRQWLTVLHAQYRRAGWSADIWPEWMADVAGEKPAANRGSVH
jgi:hypothetical protein